MKTVQPTGSQTKRGRRKWLWLLVAVIAAALVVFLRLGYWLVAEDPLQHAAAIAVLGGRMPDRAREAARIYKQGYAPEVWLTYNDEPAVELAKDGISYTGEEVYSRQVLVHDGVPDSAIRLLEPPVLNTADEMRVIGKTLQSEKLRRVIIVTSPVHTRRARTLWNLLSSSSGQAIFRGVSDDGYQPGHWWKNTRDSLDVLREFLGLINAWAGLPLQPNS